MIRSKAKIIYSTLLSSVIVSTLATSTLSSCWNNKSANTFIANDHSWIDVDSQKNQMINGNEHKSRILYESSPRIRSMYSDEESFVEQQKQEYQSNLELKVETYKNQRVRDSEEVYEMLNDLSISEDNNTIDWRSNDKNFNIVKESILSKLNDPRLSSLSDAEKSKIYNETNIELNELLLEAKNLKLCEEESDLFLTQGIKKLIEDKVTEKVEQALAYNELDGLLTSSDFKILSNAIDPEDSTDTTTSLHKLYDELNSPDLKAQTEESLLPLLFQYRDLPLYKSTISQYELSFDVPFMTWTDCVTANMTINFYLSDINTHEKLASYQFKDISIIDNKNGQIEASKKYVDSVKLTPLSQDKLPEYSAFLNASKEFEPYSSNEYFIPENKLSSLGDVSIEGVSNVDDDAYNGAIVDGVFAVGAIINFNESITNASREISLRLCIYNPKISSIDSILSINPNTQTLSLNNDSEQDAKDVVVDQLEMAEIQEGFASFLEMYKYLNDKSIKDLYKKSSDNADTLANLHKVKFWMDIVVSSSSVILDLITHAWIFTFVDLGLGAFDCWLTNKIKKQFNDQKLTYNLNLSNYNEAKESDIYKEIDELINNKTVNFQQSLREITSDLDEFTTQSQDVDGARNLKNANDLIKEFMEKYHLQTKDQVKEKIKEKTSKITDIAVHALDTTYVIFNKLKIDAISSTIEFNTKMKQLDSMVSGFDDIIVGLAGGSYMPAKTSHSNIFKGWFGNGIQNVSFAVANDAGIVYFRDVCSPDKIKNAFISDIQNIRNATDLSEATKETLLGSLLPAQTGFNAQWGDICGVPYSAKNKSLWESWSSMNTANYLVDSTGTVQTLAYQCVKGGMPNVFDNAEFLRMYREQMINGFSLSDNFLVSPKLQIRNLPAEVLGDLTPTQFFDKYLPTFSQLDKTMPDQIINRITSLPDIDKQLFQTETLVSLPGFYNDCNYTRSGNCLSEILGNAENTIQSIPDYVFDRNLFQQNIQDFTISNRARDYSTRSFLSKNGENAKANLIYLEQTFDKSLDVNEAARVSVKQYKESTSVARKKKFAKLVTQRDYAYKANATIFTEEDKLTIQSILSNHDENAVRLKNQNLGLVAERYSDNYAIVGNNLTSADSSHLTAVSMLENSSTNLLWLKATKALIIGTLVASVVFLVYSQAVDFITDIFDFSK